MVLHSKHLALLGAFSIWLLCASDANADSNGSAPGKNKSSNSAADEPAAKEAKPSPPPPPPPKPNLRSVCVRPPEVPADRHQWGYDGWGRVILDKLDKASGPLGAPEVFVFDPNAPQNSVDSLPPQHRQLRCAGSVNASAAPKKPGILDKLGATSNGKRALPERVIRFQHLAAAYSPGTDADSQQAKKFVQRLLRALEKDKPLKPLAPNDLSVRAAELLFVYFRETITAALVDREVIAPKNVQRKFMEFISDPQWASLYLVDPRVTIQPGKGTADTIPTVIVPRSTQRAVTDQVAELAPHADNLEQLQGVYEKAYSGHPRWNRAIAHYFETPPETDEQEE